MAPLSVEIIHSDTQSDLIIKNLLNQLLAIKKENWISMLEALKCLRKKLSLFTKYLIPPKNLISLFHKSELTFHVSFQLQSRFSN